MKKLFLLVVLAPALTAIRAFANNLVTNGDFTSNMTGWLTNLSSPFGNNPFGVVNQAAQIHFAATGSNMYQIVTADNSDGW